MSSLGNKFFYVPHINALVQITCAAFEANRVVPGERFALALAPERRWMYGFPRAPYTGAVPRHVFIRNIAFFVVHLTRASFVVIEILVEACSTSPLEAAAPSALSAHPAEATASPLGRAG